MCIALLSTAHPAYTLILASNRDEFIARPTAAADWWAAPDSQVLGGRDLLRSIQGTWLGITRQGRLACLTNFRESEAEGAAISGLQSRGSIPLAYLTVPPASTETAEQAATRIVGIDGIHDVGGFSLLFGQLRRPDQEGKRAPLGVISNRTPDASDVKWLASNGNEVHGLSNAHFGDASWSKVTRGETALRELVDKSSKECHTKQQLVDELFALLSIDTLPARKAGEAWEARVAQLRNSIFIPALHPTHVDGEVLANGSRPSTDLDGVYATHQQTVILVDMQGHVTFVERTLYTSDAVPRVFEFAIEGW